MKINGLYFATEGTGGGCTALVARVEGGTIALTDGNLGTAFDEMGEAVAVFYPGTTWGDDNAESHVATGDDAATAVEALIAAVSA